MLSEILKYLRVAGLVVFIASPASASVIYEFRDLGGSSLAEIELNTLPAGLTDVLSYHFTASGDAIFHLGTGNITFTDFSPFWGTSILDDGANGLKGSADYYGADVLSTLVGGPGDLYTGFYGADTDFIRSSPNVFGTKVDGHYIAAAVPEPSALALIALGLGGLAFKLTGTRRAATR